MLIWSTRTPSLRGGVSGNSKNLKFVLSIDTWFRKNLSILHCRMTLKTYGRNWKPAFSINLMPAVVGQNPSKVGEKPGGGITRWIFLSKKRGNTGKSGKRRSRESYLAAKRRAKHAVYIAKKAASEAGFSNLHEKDKLNHVFRSARKMRSENQDIIGEKCIRMLMEVLPTRKMWNLTFGKTTTKISLICWVSLFSSDEKMYSKWHLFPDEKLLQNKQT